MPNQTKLPLINSLLANTLNQRNSFEDVVDISMGFNTPFLSLVHIMNPSGSKQANSLKYEFSKRDNLGVSTQIASNALVGSNLVLTFSDPTYNQFRTNDKVMDSEQVKGIVVSSSSGTATIAPFGTVFVAATHFAAGMYCKVLTDASPNRESHGKESLYNTPSMDYNYSSAKRDSVYLDIQDTVDTYVKYKGKSWYVDQEFDMVRRGCKGMESDFIFSDLGQINAPSGLTNSNGGLIWSIKNRGGTYLKLNNLLDENIFNSMLQEIAAKNSSANKEVTILAGEGAYFIIHKFINNIGKYSGQNNTFGGKAVRGLQFNEYAIGSITAKIVPFPAFNDPILFPEASLVPGAIGSRQSNAVLMINTSANAIVGGGTAPAIELFHFGSEMYYGYINGMASAGTNVSPADFINITDTVISSDISGKSAHWLAINGINIANAKGMGYFELGQ